MALQVATRKRAKLKIGLASGAGMGKSLGSLFIAYGMLKRLHPEWSDSRIWRSIAVIDTENHSAELYSNIEKAGVFIGEFLTDPIEPPFTSEKYIQAIRDCVDTEIPVPNESAPTKIEVCIVDSLTHLWDGEGGAKDKQANIAKRTGNGFTSWREPKKEFRNVIDKILQTDMHFVVTMRSKVDYAQEKDSNGKTVVRKIGLNPIIADGTDYEFTIVFDIDSDHIAGVSKDRTGIFDGTYHKISPETGTKLADWLLNNPEGAKTEVIKPAEPVAESIPNPPTGTPDIAEVKTAITNKFRALMESGIDKDSMYVKVAEISGVKNWNKITDVTVCMSVLDMLNNLG